MKTIEEIRKDVELETKAQIEIHRENLISEIILANGKWTSMINAPIQYSINLVYKKLIDDKKITDIIYTEQQIFKKLKIFGIPCGSDSWWEITFELKEK